MSEEANFSGSFSESSASIVNFGREAYMRFKLGLAYVVAFALRRAEETLRSNGLFFSKQEDCVRGLDRADPSRVSLLFGTLGR